MNVGKPRTQSLRKRLPEQPGPSSFLQQGSLASFIQRCAVPKKPNAARKSLQGRTRSAAERSNLRNSADSGMRMQRNSSCAELYTSVQEQPPRPETRLEEEKYRTAEAINKALTDQLELLPSSDTQRRLAAASEAFESVIAAIPAYALVLKRIKKSYEECWSARGKQDGSREELEAMQDMLELQQAEKQTLLATVMQLRKEVTALSGRVMEKTTKIAALERRLLDFARRPDDDSADCETQKGSAFPALTSPKQRKYDGGKSSEQRVKTPSKPREVPLLLSAEQTPPTTVQSLMETQGEHERSQPVLKARSGFEGGTRLLKSDSFEFAAMQLDTLPSIRRLPRPERSRPYTPSTASSSDASGKGEGRLEQTNRATSLQKTAALAPFVTAQTWAVTDGSTGTLLWGSMETERREIASLTKIMTCYLSLQLLRTLPALSSETIIPVSHSAASMVGTSARLRAGDELCLLDALYGLMLPSGNDAAYCLAEFFGRMLHERCSETAGAKTYVSRFVREMNRAAKDLGLDSTNYSNPHGLPNIKNRSTARDVGLLASIAMKDAQFAEIVNTQTYSCYVMQSESVYPYRKLKWSNTNRLLEHGWDGVKTGITTVAGPCLCASGRRTGAHIIVTVLGSKSMDRRWAEVQKLGKWAFGKLGVEVKVSESVNRL